MNTTEREAMIAQAMGDFSSRSMLFCLDNTLFLKWEASVTSITEWKDNGHGDNRYTKYVYDYNDSAFYELEVLIEDGKIEYQGMGTQTPYSKKG